MFSRCTVTTLSQTFYNIPFFYTQTTKTQVSFLFSNLNAAHLNDKCSTHDGAEDGVVEDAVKHVPLAVDLAGVDFVEQLHHHKDVEDDGVVFRGWSMERRVPAAVDVENPLTCGQEVMSSVSCVSQSLHLK